MLWPDNAADLARFEELRDGKVHLWQDLAMKASRAPVSRSF
jgi:hypothetical protein